MAMDSLPLRARIMILAGLLLGMLVTALDQTIVSTAMPRIIANLGGMDLYSWTFTTYMLASTSMMPVFGKLSDIYGRRRFFILGIVVFMLGSWLSGASQSMVELIIFRGIQGVGAASIMPIAIAAIADAFPPAQRSKIQGIMAGTWGLASIIGPILGGYISDQWSWRWIFYVNIPVGVLAIAVTYFNLIDRPYPGTKRQIDYLGVLTLLAGILPLLLAISMGGNEYAWGSPVIIGLFAFAAAMLALFPFLEARQSEPLIPLSLFRSSIFTVSVINVFLVGIGVFGAMLFVPLFLQTVPGISATDSGLILTPMSVAMVIASAVGGQLMTRSYRNVAVVSMAVLLAGFFFLATINANTTPQQVMLYMVIVGIAMGPVMPVFMIAVQNSVEHARIGIATSSIQFFRSMGGTIGVTLLGALMANSIDAQVKLQSPGATAALGAGSGIADAEFLLDPASALAKLPPPFLSLLKVALADSIHQIFTVAFVVLVLAFVATLFLKDAPLRKTWDREPAPAQDDAEVISLAPDPVKTETSGE